MIAGDIITAKPGRELETALQLLRELVGEYPVYYGMGNHEQRIGMEPGEGRNLYETYMESLHQAGIEPLINEKVSLPAANINICGLQIDRCYYQKFSKYPMPENYRNILKNMRRGERI